MPLIVRSFLEGEGGGGGSMHIDTLTITHQPNTLTYVQGETIDTTGMVVTASASGMSGTVTSYCVVTPQILETSGTQEITVTYGDATATFNVTVYAMESISIISQPTKTAYIQGETLDLTGISVRAIAGSLTRDVTNSCTYSPANGSTLSSSGTITITASLSGLSDTTTVTSYAITEIEITTPPNKTLYSPNETLDLTGIVVSGFANNKAISVNITDSCSFVPTDGTVLTTEGTFTLTVTYQSLTTTMQYTVSQLTIVTFADGTDAQIKAMLDAHYRGEIDIHDYWNVGDTRDIQLASYTQMNGTVKESQTAQLFIVDSSHGKELESPIGNITRSAFAVAIAYNVPSEKNIIYINTNAMRFNDTATTEGGWNSSLVRSFLNSSFKNALPQSVLSIAKSHKNYGSKGGSDETVMIASTDMIALPSEKEILKGWKTFKGVKSTMENDYQFEFFVNWGGAIRQQGTTEMNYVMTRSPVASSTSGNYANVITAWENDNETLSASTYTNNMLPIIAI